MTTLRPFVLFSLLGLSLTLSCLTASQTIISEHSVQAASLLNESDTFPWITFPQASDKPVILQTGGAVGGGPGSGPGSCDSQCAPIVMFAVGNSRQGQGGSRQDGSSTTWGAGLFQWLWSWLWPPGEGSRQKSPGEQPPDDGNQVREEHAFNNFLAEIDVLMMQLQGEVVLVTDMDDTILPSNHSDQRGARSLFKSFVEKWRARGKLRLIIVTRAGVRLRHWSQAPFSELPVPDYLIAGGNDYDSLNIQSRDGVSFAREIMPASGDESSVEVREDGVTIASYGQYVAERMNSLEQLLREQSLPVLSVGQPSTSGESRRSVEFESTYDLSINTGLIREAVFRIFGVLGEVAISPDSHEIQISMPFYKGSFLARLAAAMSLTGANVIAAGDSIDDQSMLAPRNLEGYSVATAVVVGNAEPNIRGILGGRDNIIISEYPCLLGVAEGFLQGLKRLVSGQIGTTH